ncbi:LytTR family DNA-binding domain-containing protein [Lewinella sp. 4G2]|uniref:LytR/AlgR family response regulator transcription factor n=1 Tax=Lewinella sp. 4G2 TaxID=1803372 RepID=UPI0007B4B4D3|nr:LytTR family DNA-binding domain-containing protein [Lewinella sp. 4G2]OAV44600.1 hypothetical protein A3850_008895 [Lewinella sp. 4G2]
MKALIIDDEAPNREALAHYLTKYCPGVTVVGQADSVAPALELIAAEEPDLLFLDIEMPFGNGFDLLERLPEGTNPQVVFVTAYEQYALRALRMSAAHYLLKPVDIDELIEAVARVRSRLAMGESGRVHETLLHNLKKERAAPPERLALPLLDGLEIVRPAEIRYLEAADNFTVFHLADGRQLMICRKLRFYADLLEGSGFYRIHRSTVINLAEVQRYHRGKGGTVTLRGGVELDVAGARKKGLLEVLG